MNLREHHKAFAPKIRHLAKAGGNQVEPKNEGCFFYNFFKKVNMSPERNQNQSKLPPELRRATVLLATSKRETLARFLQAYSHQNTVAVNPSLHGKNEPSANSPLASIAFRLEEVSKIVSLVEKRTGLIIGPDNTFNAPDGLTHHQAGRREDLTQDEIDALIVETIGWYSQPFIASWENGFGYQTVGVKKPIHAAVNLEIKVSSERGMCDGEIQQGFNPRINARLPLAEKAQALNAEFTIANAGDKNEYVISSDLALMLIVNKVLPPEFFTLFYAQAKSTLHNQDTLSVVQLDLDKLKKKGALSIGPKAA
jgi:hypothetical protein